MDLSSKVNSLTYLQKLGCLTILLAAVMSPGVAFSEAATPQEDPDDIFRALGFPIWKCVCFCQVTDSMFSRLLNPETGDRLFFPGGDEEECEKINGHVCKAMDVTLNKPVFRGTYRGCEWSLVS